MSAGGSGESKTKYPPQTIMGLGVVGGLIGVYAGGFLAQSIPALSFIGGIGAICAAIWGADAVRRVASYGLGTGVPSIGLLALGMGIVAALFGLSIGGIAGPIIAFIVACIIGVVIGALANRVIGMGIPVMESTMTEIAGSGALLILGLSVTIAGSFAYAPVLDYVVRTGFVAMIYIAGGMAMLHPFNANLGADESQDRTLACAIQMGAASMVISGIASAVGVGLGPALVTVVIGLIIWYFAFHNYYALIKRDAYAVVGTGLLPSAEELQ
jgi:tetrahydromethanopterin S-methyltransferase subunit C